MLKISFTNQYLKDLELIKRRNLPKSELDAVVKLLSEEKPLPQKYKDHALKGRFASYRECHIRPDWLLIYRIDKQVLALVLTRTGTHSDLF
jgi:mRNA interferase YafQ